MDYNIGAGGETDGITVADTVLASARQAELSEAIRS